MEFDLREMNSVARGLLAGVTADAELLRKQVGGAAANRFERRAKRLTALATDLEHRVDAIEGDGWAALNAALEQLQCVTAEESANVGAVLREVGTLHEDVLKLNLAAKDGAVVLP